MQVIRASVKPHAISLATGEVLALEDAIESWIERDARGVILIRGDEGSGRTTALRHLAAVLPAADLRGTNVEDVDFYLVDLRGARFSHDQRQHFERCGAILD
jgi:energy-coupling factor transporter ATP-binding protein EcfA2